MMPTTWGKWNWTPRKSSMVKFAMDYRTPKTLSTIQSAMEDSAAIELWHFTQDSASSLDVQEAYEDAQEVDFHEDDPAEILHTVAREYRALWPR